MTEIKLILICFFPRLSQASCKDDISCLFKSNMTTASTGITDKIHNYQLKVLNKAFPKNNEICRYGRCFLVLLKFVCVVLKLTQSYK